MLSKSCEYGIKATLFIAQKSQDEDRVSLKQISDAIDSPIAFTAKILQKLVKSDIINSKKGPTGGFEIDKERLSQINLKQIVLAIDGNKLFEGCALGFSVCNPNEPCPMHSQFISIRNQLNKTLESSNLLKVATELNLGHTVLKR